MVFQQKLLKKGYFIVKMTGLAIIRLASSDFQKAPQVKSEKTTQTKHSIPELISFIISSVWANWKSTVCSICCSLPAEKEYMYSKLIKCQNYHFQAKLLTYK